MQHRVPVKLAHVFWPNEAVKLSQVDSARRQQFCP